MELRTGWVITGLLLCTIWAAPPASAQTTSPVVVQAVGCYALELGEWSPPRLDGNRAYQTPPRRIILKAERGTHFFEKGRLLLRPVIPAPHTSPRERMAYWRTRGRDSLHLTWTNGYAGVRMALQLRGDSLKGVAEALSDAQLAGRSSPKAQVRGERIDCRGLETGTGEMSFPDRETPGPTREGRVGGDGAGP